MKEEDKQSLQKAKNFFITKKDKTIKPGSIDGLKTIHFELFNGIYDCAGTIRTVNISKGYFRFASCIGLESVLTAIEGMPDSTFDDIIKKYVELNVAHPFREGNGRAGRIWLDILLRDRLKKIVDWHVVDKCQYLSAMERSPINDLEIYTLLKNNLTEEINDRDKIFKSMEQSYRYEE